MSKPSIQNITTTQTFQNWLDKTNEMVDIFRDSAITASALMELAQYAKGEEKEKYINDGVKMIQSLSNETYRAKEGENGGFLIKHCVGALTLNSEIDVPLIYADYYFLEALKRYKDWYLNN